MNYLEKISERSSDEGKNLFSHPQQALPVRNPVWPELPVDPETRNGENEDFAILHETPPDMDYRRGDRDSGTPDKPENKLRLTPVRPPIEILPGKMINTNWEQKNEQTAKIPFVLKEETPDLIPGERITVIEKISERIHSGKKPFIETDAGKRNPHFANPEKKTSEMESFLPSGQLPRTESRKQALQPGIRNQPSPISGKAIPEKTTMQPFLEPGVHKQTNKKKETENKLIIGRITVEVTQPTTPPASSPVPQRQYAGSRSPVNEMNTIDKLSFGLGQL